MSRFDTPAFRRAAAATAATALSTSVALAWSPAALAQPTPPAPAPTAAPTTPAPTPAPSQPAPTASPTPTAPAAPTSLADLRVDANRDGKVDVTGESDDDKRIATPSRGAVFLANLDDDARRCALRGPDKKFLPLEKLKSCNDAADNVVNGPQDVKDLAPLRTVPMPAMPKNATGTLRVEGKAASHTRLFINRGGAWTVLKPKDTLTAADLTAGLTLGLEGTDLIRDAAVWNGTATVRLEVTTGKVTHTDRAMLRQAPLVTHNHTQAITRAYAPGADSSRDAAAYVKRLRPLLSRLRGIPVTPLTGMGEQWVQDSFEPAYQVMPGDKRAQKMRVMLKTDQKRTSDQALYQMRGRDMAVVTSGTSTEEYTLDSGGNIETLPPYIKGGNRAPFGRVILGRRETMPDNPPKERPRTGGSPAEEPRGDRPHSHGDTGRDHDHEDAPQPPNPSPAMVKLLTAQSGQEPIFVDTGFLSVGHVDEFLQVVPARNARGWTLAVIDPMQTMRMLQDLKRAGMGKKNVYGGKNSHISIDDATDDFFLRHHQWAGRIIEKNIDRLVKATGLKRSEIIRVPVLLRPEVDTHDGVFDPTHNSTVEFALPNAINGIMIDRGGYLAPLQHGMRMGGRDVFGDLIAQAYRKAGVAVSFIDDFEIAHLGGGNSHCVTNALRVMTPYTLRQD